MSLTRRLTQLRVAPLIRSSLRLSLAKSRVPTKHFVTKMYEPTLYQTSFPAIPRANGIAKITCGASKAEVTTRVAFHTKEEIAKAVGGGKLQHSGLRYMIKGCRRPHKRFY